MTTTLRAGDRVRAITESYGDDVAPVGSLGTVLSMWAFDAHPYVGFDGDPGGDGSGGWAMNAHQVERVVRRWRDRVWFWKPQLHWFGWRTLVPFARGGDEWDWHTILIGWTFTGRIIVALHRCPQTGRCAGEEPLGHDWPAEPYDYLDEALDAEAGWVAA